MKYFISYKTQELHITHVSIAVMLTLANDFGFFPAKVELDTASKVLELECRGAV